MKKHGLIRYLLILSICVGWNTANSSTLAITEWMNDPKGLSDAEGEWIEVFNYGRDAVNLSGYQISDDNYDYIFDNEMLEPGKFLLVVKDLAAFNDYWFSVLPSESLVIEVPGLALANTTDEIKLSDGENVIWTVGYADDDSAAAGYANFLSVDDFSRNDYGTEISPAVNRNGNDEGFTHLGYEQNNYTADIAASVVGDDTASPGRGNYTSELARCTAEALTLTSGVWHQISLPCDPGESDRVMDIFSDDISAEYGDVWTLWAYDTSTNTYQKLTPEDKLNIGVGYWLLQTSGVNINVDMPASSLSVQDEFNIPLITESSAHDWNMIGAPYASIHQLQDLSLKTSADACVSGCSLEDSISNKLLHHTMYHYDVDGERYQSVDQSSGGLSPWSGYWMITLEDANGLNPVLWFSAP